MEKNQFVTTLILQCFYVLIRTIKKKKDIFRDTSAPKNNTTKEKSFKYLIYPVIFARYKFREENK